ncbi:MAG: adenylate/guanylate cyclase domain-containing protein [Solirubrobacterales bacterium]
MPVSTHYALNDGVNIAYQVTGEGPDLVVVPGFVSHLEMDWAEPQFAAFLEQLGSFCRLIRLDKRGTGLSDPAPGIPTLEERMEDVHAVMDAAGSERATLLGYSEGGPMSTLFAATYPERTQGLIIYGSFPNGAALLGERFLRDVIDHWGEGNIVNYFAPSVAHEPGRRMASGAYERAAASPGMARALIAALDQTDVSAVLPHVRVPALVLHRRGDMFPVESARWMAGQLQNGRFVELEGADHTPFYGDAASLLGEIEEFVTGTRSSGVVERALATVLFTDIVESTRRASELGDRTWRELLTTHNELTREHVLAARGQPIKSTGDGYLATFDGPARAVNCARELTTALAALGIQIRAGIHTGECELMGDDIAGLAVHIGARIGALGGPGEVVVSSTVKDLVVGSAIKFADRGEHELKGVPDRWHLYTACDNGDEESEPIDNSRAHRPGDRLGLALARHAPEVSRRLMGALSRTGSRRA